MGEKAEENREELAWERNLAWELGAPQSCSLLFNRMESTEWLKPWRFLLLWFERSAVNRMVKALKVQQKHGIKGCMSRHKEWDWRIPVKSGIEGFVVLQKQSHQNCLKPWTFKRSMGLKIECLTSEERKRRLKPWRLNVKQSPWMVKSPNFDALKVKGWSGEWRCVEAWRVEMDWWSITLYLLLC